MITIVVDKSDLQGLKASFEKLEEGIKKGLSKSALFMEAQARILMGKPGKPQVRTGRLRAGIRSGVTGMSAWINNSVKYAPVQEFGATIKGKNGGYLRFQIGGQWVSVKQVVIPARPVMYPAVENNIDRINEIIRKEIIGAIQ